MANAKLTNEQREEIAKRFMDGDSQADLAEDYDVCKGTIVRVLRILKAVRTGPKPATVSDLTAFAKRVRSILWAQGGATDHDDYDSWEVRVKELASEDGAGLSKNEAIVRAAKEYPCLNQLFREYNVRAYDPNPESHPRIRHFGEPDKHSVECEGIDLSYRESLDWAIEAAGKTKRTGVKPKVCPCDRAWYLYEQAVSDPKDFLSRVGQIEAKGDAESADKRNARLSGVRSIDEIDGMLAELEAENEEITAKLNEFKEEDEKNDA